MQMGCVNIVQSGRTCSPVCYQGHARLRLVSTRQSPHRHSIERDILDTIGINLIWDEEAQTVVQKIALAMPGYTFSNQDSCRAGHN